MTSADGKALPYPPATDAGSLAREATGRLLLSFFFAVLVTLVAANWFYAETRDKIAAQRNREAVTHYGNRIRQLEFDWENYALRIKAQIEYSKILDDGAQSSPRLTALLTLISRANFGGIAVLDGEGRVIFTYGDINAVLPSGSRLPTTPQRFYFDSGSGQLFRTLYQPLWLKTGPGHLVLLKTLDNALLFQNRYPDTELFLAWQDKVVARSVNEPDMGTDITSADDSVVTTRNGMQFRQFRIPWPGVEQIRPILLVETRIFSPVTATELALTGTVMLLAATLFSWVTVGRWLGSTARRAVDLAGAADAFAGRQRLTPDIERVLQEAKSGSNDELDRVATALDHLMKIVEARDVEQILYQGELERQMRELERINAELDDFNYIASHDLREPLRKLVSFSDLLRQDVGDALPAQAEEDLHYIVDAAQRMRALIDDLLALSRAGTGALATEEVALDKAVDDALETLSLRIKESKAEINRDPLPTVSGDARLLTQLFQNLIGNALKYVPSGVAPEIRITCDPEAGVFGVKDNGIGIKPEFSEQIFKPFKRLHSRDEYEGSGVGLSICRKIVERHQGRIWVESSGKGAHFQFTLGDWYTSSPTEEPVHPKRDT